MNKIAIIPARGGSKRIPGKNKKAFLGKPIITYPISVAIESGLFDEVIVFTDDEEIASIAQSAGASVPFQRGKENAGDHATLSDVLAEVLTVYSAAGKNVNYVCMILPAAALLKSRSLEQSWSLLQSKNYSSVVPVLRFAYPVQRALQIDQEQRLTFIDPAHRFTRSQDLSPAFHDAGQFYWVRTEDFLRSHSIFMKNTGAIELDEMEVQDIDTETDWSVAEMKYALLNKEAGAS